MDIVQSYERSVNFNLYSYSKAAYSEANISPFNRIVQELVELSCRDMEEEGFDLGSIALQLELQLSYGQQRQTLPIVAPQLKLNGVNDIKAICDRFNDAYAEKYGRGACFPEAGIEVTDLRLNAVGSVEKYTLQRKPGTNDDGGALVGTRKAHWGPERGTLETAIYRRDALSLGAEIPGPAIVEADDTVIVTPPGWRYSTDSFGIGWLERS